MKKLFLILFLLPSLLFSQDKVKFVAGGVTCSLCSNAIQKSLQQDKNIKKVDVNLDTQEWILEYSENSFTIESLKKRVEDAGFSLMKVWRGDKIIYEKKRKK